MITLSTRSLERLAGVHPGLVRVVKRAAALATPTEDFMVQEGVRTRQRMCELYGQGRHVAECEAKGVPGKYAAPLLAKVTWLNNPFNSEHRVHDDGYGHAVDVVPVPVDWKDLERFDAMAALMFEAAHLEAVNITWGADWDHDGIRRERGESDSPHFQLS